MRWAVLCVLGLVTGCAGYDPRLAAMNQQNRLLQQQVYQQQLQRLSVPPASPSVGYRPPVAGRALGSYMY